MKNEDLKSKLYGAIKEYRVDDIDDIIYSGYDVNTVDENGDTPLLYAYKYETYRPGNTYRLSSIKRLLEFEANPNFTFKTVDGSETTILFELCKKTKKDSYELLRFLVKNGADTDIRNSRGETPLMIAISNAKSYDFIKTILYFGRSDINAVDSNNETVVFKINYNDINSYYNILNLLAENGADFNWKDNSGKTVLFRIDMKKCSLLEEVLQAGADPNVKDTFGNSLIKIVTKTYLEVLKEGKMFQTEYVSTNLRSLLMHGVIVDF